MIRRLHNLVRRSSMFCVGLIWGNGLDRQNKSVIVDLFTFILLRKYIQHKVCVRMRHLYPDQI